MSADFRVRDAAADQRMIDTPSILAYLPRILGYPLTGYALPVVLVFSAFLWIGLHGLTGIALLAIVTPWAFHYAEEVIARTAIGQATPPAFGGDMLFLANLSALRPLVGIGLILSVWGWMRLVEPGAAGVVLVIAAFLMPAYLLLLATHHSLWVALNPLSQLQIIAGMGATYLVLCAVLAMAIAVATSVANTTAIYLTLVLSLYTLIALCHLLGFVVFHHAERLGLPSPDRTTSQERETQAREQARLDTALAPIDAALARSDLQAAANALYGIPDPEDKRLAFHEALFQQMERRRQSALIQIQGQRLITALLQAKQPSRALEVAESCLDAGPQFVPTSAVEALLLLEEAVRQGRDAAFERLSAPLHERFSGHPEQVSLDFLCARYWYDRRNDAARAQAILRPLLKSAKAHPKYPQITAYARALLRPAPRG